MCTARAKRTTLKDQPGLKSLTGQPTIGTYLRGPLRRDAEWQTSIRKFEVPIRRRDPDLWIKAVRDLTELNVNKEMRI
jgi:hypothetical protein